MRKNSSLRASRKTCVAIYQLLLPFLYYFFYFLDCHAHFFFFAMTNDLRYFVVSFKYDKTAVVFIVVFCGKYGLVWFGD